MRIAFFTALKEERAAIRQAWPTKDSGTLRGLPLDSGERAVCLCTGVGPERMAAAVSQGLRVFNPSLAVLLGFGAGLQDRLAVGDVVCDERSDPTLVRSLRAYPIPLRFGQIALTGFLRTAQDKRRVAEERPDCLVADMESEAFIKAVGNTPFLIMRSISDGVDTDLPLAFDRLLTAGGFPDEMAILRQLARRPALLPSILNLAQSTAYAQRTLIRTVADIKPLLIRRLLECR
jgi:nucleoside phosphorylase